MPDQLAAQLQGALGPGYRVEQQIDGGGMSRLFLATEIGLNRRVVVKVLPPDLTNELSVARFKREIDLTVKLQHPSILPVLTAGSWEDTLYYISPFIPGESLRARISREQRFPLDEVVRMLREAGEALAYAHSRGVVHRDVKPENILLSEGHAILADFGIARALNASSGSGSLTGSGMIPGTPAYMAPELPSDQRGDIYALGVVGYEMLTGALPPRGVSAKQIAAARGAYPGESRPALRRVAEVLAKALEVAPERRTATTAEFTASLAALPGRRAFPWWPAAFAAAAVVGTFAWRSIHGAGAVVERNPYLVIPFRGVDQSLTASVTRRVGDALGEWQGVSVIADQRVRDAMPRAGEVMSLERAKEMARSLGARSVVLGDVERQNDSVVIHVSDYAVFDSASARSFRSAYAPTSDTNATTTIRRAVNSLLRDGAQLPWRNAADVRQPVLSSWKEYDRGRVALSRWDLADAEVAFHAAIASDPSNASAQLWLAQTFVWADKDSAGELRSVARQANAARTDLTAHDARLAAALWALADSQYVDACHGFDEMVKSDATDLAAWTGVGDCRKRDPVVLPDARSRSGFAFRGSYAGAAAAYLRAGEVAPGSVDPAFRGWLMKRLGDVLYTHTNHLRGGRVQGPTHEAMYGAAFLSGDTIGFAPLPLREVAGGKSAVPAEAVDAAVARNLETLRHAAEQWVLRAPRSADAYAGLTALAEATGGFAFLGETRISALDAAKRAQSLTTDPGERFRLAIVQARLLIKADQFEAARKTADSILSAAGAQSRGSVELAGLAVLLGRPAQAAQLLAENNTDPKVTGRGGVITLPPAVLKERLRLLAYAALGMPPDSVHQLALRADAAVRNYISGDSATAEARAGVLGPSLSLMFPGEGALLASISTTDRMIHAQQQALKNPPAVVPLLRDMMRQANAHPPAQAMDGPYRMATIALTLGDTTTAIALLDRALGALPTIGEALFLEVPQVAGLLRAMILRADLAAARHDAPTARRWGAAVATLWVHGEPDLQPVLDRMRRVA